MQRSAFTFGDYPSLSAARAWNEQQAERHFKRAANTKNNYRRERFRQDGQRYIRNVVLLNALCQTRAFR